MTFGVTNLLEFFMRLAILLVCVCVSAVFCGCRPVEDDASDARGFASNIDQIAESRDSTTIALETDPIMFRGEYDRTTGPCIDLGGGARGIPFIDTFKVIDVLEGTMKVKNVNVREMTEGGPNYPQELKEGNVYTLRLTPSGTTSRQLRENEKDGLIFLWVNGIEIAEHRANN